MIIYSCVPTIYLIHFSDYITKSYPPAADMLITHAGEDPTLVGCNPVVTHMLMNQALAVDIQEGCNLERCSVNLKHRKYDDKE